MPILAIIAHTRDRVWDSRGTLALRRRQARRGYMRPYMRETYHSVCRAGPAAPGGGTAYGRKPAAPLRDVAFA